MSYPRRFRLLTSGVVTIPIGGGRVTTTVSKPADFTRIEFILHVNVKRLSPEVDDVYEPSVGINATQDAVGLTLVAGTGTTLQAEIGIIGY